MADGNSCTDEELMEVAKTAEKLARVPVSGFHVGAAVVGSSTGDVLTGCNIELQGAPMNAAIHAEQCAIARAWYRNERSISKVAATAAPCGHCRQWLLELRNAQSIRVVLKQAAEQETLTVPDLLPHSFSAADIHSVNTAESCVGTAGTLLEPATYQTPSRSFATQQAELECNRKRASMEAARWSFAPYSGCPSGVALELADGIIVPGAQLESAAFNPTLSALQTALSILVAEHGYAISDILRISVAEKADAHVQYARFIQILFPAVEIDRVIL